MSIGLTQSRKNLFSLGGGFWVCCLGVSLVKVGYVESLLRQLREEERVDYVLGVKANLAAGVTHLLMVVQQAWSAWQQGSSMARKFEVEVLLRLVCTTQISEAMQRGRVGPKDRELILILVGRSLQRKRILALAQHYGTVDTSIIEPDAKRLAFLRNIHLISSALEDATRGFRYPLPSLLAEKSALLVS